MPTKLDSEKEDPHLTSYFQTRNTVVRKALIFDGLVSLVIVAYTIWILTSFSKVKLEPILFTWLSLFLMAASDYQTAGADLSRSSTEIPTEPGDILNSPVIGTGPVIVVDTPNKGGSPFVTTSALTSKVILLLIIAGFLITTTWQAFS